MFLLIFVKRDFFFLKKLKIIAEIFGCLLESAYLCIRFRSKPGGKQIRKSSLKDFHKQTSSTRSECFFSTWVIERTVNKMKRSLKQPLSNLKDSRPGQTSMRRCRALIRAVSRRYNFTMKSLILAQDER